MKIYEYHTKKERTERIIQFGEGGFLRGFVSWMIQKLNDSRLFDGSIVIVQPIKDGICADLASQNCLYTHVIRGAEGEEKTLVDSVSRCINPYEDFDAYLKLAENPHMRFIVSNTTEAGIAYDENDKISDTPPKSFPAKLTLLLHKRFTLGLPGFVLLPCELIEKNGEKLRECVIKYAKLWNLGKDFIEWTTSENVFANTLVDRINTGYPKDGGIELPYEDKMLNVSEFYHLWVIETAHDIEAELPLKQAGLNVIVTKNELYKYRERKVRILNGAHTLMTPYAILEGLETVKDCMDSERMRAYVLKGIFEEIIPTLDLPEEELEDYANSVITRFENPYNKHYLMSIALNSISKFGVRVLPSIKEYKKRFGKYPETLVFGFKKLLEFYKVGTPVDADDVIETVKHSSLSDILKSTTLWGEDLSELYEVMTYDNT